MTSVDAYLDVVCGRLRVNPAQVEDIREELRCHLEELIGCYRAEGMEAGEAIERALSWFGSPRQLRDCLGSVHQGDAWWVKRLKGLGVGMILGGIVSLLIPIGGHPELAAPLSPLLAAMEAPRAQALANAMMIGGMVGLLSAGGRGILVGWSVGSVVWLAECAACWVASVTGGGTEPTVNMLNVVLLAPLVGGIFGAAVGAGSASILSAASRARPQLQ